MKQTKKRTVPAFATEAEEAQWWYRNRKDLDKDLLPHAARSGKLKLLDRKTLLERAARSRAAKVIGIRLPESDLALARLQAAKKGLPYQTYIKSLLHQALQQESKPR